MSGITTHVLDTARGMPAEGVEVTLSARDGENWRELARARTDADGRARPQPEGVPPGTYRLRFETGAWAATRGAEAFHPWVDVTFEVLDTGRHYHVPLLLSPFGYTTYRGS